MTPEIWMPMGYARPETVAEHARRAEADGWDGLKVYDTQCLFGEVFVMLTTAALATEHLKLSLSTSNPVTRHPSVAASAIASAAAVAGPRIWYGIGRGDSSLAYVGGAPARVRLFERYVSAVRRYLHGEGVPFEDIAEWCLSEDVSTIPMGNRPPDSSLRWLDPAAPPVPIEVCASGPLVLAVAGRQADRVTLGLGGDKARLRWAVDVARQARADAGLDPDTLSFQAIIPLGAAPTMAQARRSVVNMVASEARFSVMSGKVSGPVSPAQRAVYDGVAASYDMEKHGELGEQANVITDEFLDDFAIVGPPERCIERVVELVDLGIDSFMLAPPQGDTDAGDIRAVYDLIVGEVLPGIRKATAV